MQFKPPGGELTFWSSLWVLFGIGSCVVGIVYGRSEHFILGALVGLPALGMWFDQRWCGYLFAGLLVVSLPLGTFLLIAVDETIFERAVRLLRMGMAVYFAWISFRWAQCK